MKYTVLILLVAAHFNYLAEKKERSICSSNNQSVLNNDTSVKKSLSDDSGSPALNILNGKQCKGKRLPVSEPSDNLIFFVRHAVQLR